MWKGAAVAAGMLGVVVGLSGCFANGIHKVGSGAGEVQPGLYTSTRPLAAGQQCEVSVYANGQHLGGDQEFGGRSFVEVLPSDTGILSDQCGVWVKPQAGSYNPNRTTAQYGAYRVPIDLLPGTYAASGGPYCSWTRVSSFDTRKSSLIATSYNPDKGFQGGLKNPTVTIKSTDAGFLSDLCGGWRRVAS